MAWYEKHSSPKESIQALTLIARALRQKGDYSGALDSFQQQLVISRQLELQAQVALSEEGIGTVLMIQGRWPEALASFRDEYDAAKHAGAEFNLQYSQVELTGVLWRLGRYGEARQFLEQMGTKTSSAIAADIERLHADIALSQRQFAAAAARCRGLLSQSGLSNDVVVEAKLMLGRAQMASGARTEGAAAIAEAAALAAKGSNPRLIAEAALAQADALLAAGNGAKSLESAMAAQQFFAKTGNLEREWHCWLAAARAANSRDEAQKAAGAIAQLRQKWDSDDYASYAKRPDIQYERAQLEKLLGRKLDL